jgi:hypothetical protein
VEKVKVTGNIYIAIICFVAMLVCFIDRQQYFWQLIGFGLAAVASYPFDRFHVPRYLCGAVGLLLTFF